MYMYIPGEQWNYGEKLLFVPDTFQTCLSDMPFRHAFGKKSEKFPGQSTTVASIFSNECDLTYKIFSLVH